MSKLREAHEILDRMILAYRAELRDAERALKVLGPSDSPEYRAIYQAGAYFGAVRILEQYHREVFSHTHDETPKRRAVRFYDGDPM